MQSIKIVEIKQFSKNEEDYYRGIFNEQKGKQKILNESFDDKVWTLRDSNYRVNVSFVDLPKDLTLALKGFATLRITSVSPKYIQRCIDNLGELLYFLYPFHLDRYLEYQEAFWGKPPFVRDYIATVGKQFFSFVEIPNSESLLHFLNKYHGEKSQPRVLPNYFAILLFDLIVDAFWEEELSIEERLEFYPIVLWWKVASTIPLRIGEFLKLTVDDFGIRNGLKWMKLPRIKQKTLRSDDIEPVDEVELDDGLYKLLCECREMIADVTERTSTRKIINYEVRVLNSIESHRQIQAWESKNNPEVYENMQFSRLLDKFYDKIVGEKYCFKPVKKTDSILANRKEIEMLDPNDTRHIAICNLLCQGVSPLTIAKLANHNRIETQRSYQQHLETFLQSKVQCLTIQLSLFGQDRGQTIKHGIPQPLLRRLEGRSKLYNKKELERYPKVGLGYCIHPSHKTGTFNGYECKGSHEFCDYYIIDFEKNPKALQETKKVSLILESDIKERLKKLLNARTLAETINENLDMYVENRTELLSNAQILQRLIAQKGLVDSRILDEESEK